MRSWPMFEKCHNLSWVANREKMQGKTIMQTVFSAKHDKSVYCSWRNIGCVTAGSAKNKASFWFKKF